MLQRIRYEGIISQSHVLTLRHDEVEKYPKLMHFVH